MELSGAPWIRLDPESDDLAGHHREPVRIVSPKVHQTRSVALFGVSGKPTLATETFIGTEKGAGKALSALVAKVNAGKFNRSTATVGQLLDKWLEATEPHQRPRTVYENKRKIEARIRPKLGSVRLDRLGADTLDAAYRQWLDEGLSAATVHK
jgi:hypothetical protein